MNQQRQKQEKMLREPVGRLVAGLALPAICSMLVTSFYNMADTFFVGQISTSATGAVGVSFGLMSLIQALGFFFGHGSGNYISRQLGRGRVEDAKRMASLGFWLSFGFGLLLSALGLCLGEGLATVLGATPTILPHAMAYMRIILLGAPFMCASFNLNNQLRFQGNTVLGMVGIVCGAALNLALDPLFIFTFQMGVAGAAWATLISQVVSFFVLLAGCMGKKSLGLSLRGARPSRALCKEIAVGGLPSLLRQGFMAIGVVCLNQACRVAGDPQTVDAAIAAMGVVGKIVGFVFSVILGIGQGFQPVCGFNYGAGRYNRVKKAYWLCVWISSGVLLVLCSVCFALAPTLIGLFRKDPAVVAIGATALRWQSVGMLLSGFTTMSNMMLQNIGKVVRASVLAVARQGLFFVPLVLGLCAAFGLTGLFIAQPLADFLSFASAMAMHLPVLGSLRENAEEKM